MKDLWHCYWYVVACASFLFVQGFQGHTVFIDAWCISRLFRQGRLLILLGTIPCAPYCVPKTFTKLEYLNLLSPWHIVREVTQIPICLYFVFKSRYFSHFYCCHFLIQLFSGVNMSYCVFFKDISDTSYFAGYKWCLYYIEIPPFQSLNWILHVLNKLSALIHNAGNGGQV